MTVGELVTEKRRKDMIYWIQNTEPTPNYRFPESVLSETLRDIGIWDAEVLDYKCDSGDGQNMLYGRPDYGELGFDYGDKIRLIVLPERKGE